MINLSSRQKVFYLLSVGLALILMWMGVGRITKLITGTNKQKVVVSVLAEEFQRIPAPLGAERRRGITRFDKEIITGVNEVIGSSLTADEVVLYYMNEAPKRGWIFFSDERKKDGRKVKFCKNGMSLIVDASSGKVGAEYYLGVAWAKHSASSAYCASDR